ncbi:hypothetical protein RXV91_07405 [Lactiplantibacillus sp. DA1]|nr:hypothetical protein [Lactiplantibacillus sp. DA1]MDV0430693.1 hypothetical protein [Lactiplantibacillus sp. DA1]
MGTGGALLEMLQTVYGSLAMELQIMWGSMMFCEFAVAQQRLI